MKSMIDKATQIGEAEYEALPVEHSTALAIVPPSPAALATAKPLMHNASMSKTDVLLKCQWWSSPQVRLPKTSDDPRTWDEIPRFGVAAHKCMELHLEKKPVKIRKIARFYDVPPDKLRDYYCRLSGLIDALLKKRGWYDLPKFVETKFAYDPFKDKARILKSTKTRDYSEKLPTELPGTCDLAFYVPSERIFVVFDWKTGVKEYDAAKNPQLRSLSCALRALKPEYQQGYACIVRIDGEFMEMFDAPMTKAIMDAHRDRLKKKMRLALSPNPPIRPGTYCNWCEANPICPAQGGPLALREMIDGIYHPEHVVAAYTKLIAIEQLARFVRKTVTEAVRALGPLDLDNGKHVEVIKGSKRDLSMASIKNALGNEKGEEVIEELEKMKCIKKIEYEQLVMRGKAIK